MNTPTKTTKPYTHDFEFDHDAYAHYLTGATSQILKRDSLKKSINSLAEAVRINEEKGGNYNRARADLAYSYALKAEFEKDFDENESQRLLAIAEGMAQEALDMDTFHDPNGFDYAPWWARAFCHQIRQEYFQATDMFCAADVNLFSRKTDPEEKRNNFRVEYLEAIAWELKFSGGATGGVSIEPPSSASGDKTLSHTINDEDGNPMVNAGTGQVVLKAREDWLKEKARLLIQEYATPSGHQLWSIAWAHYALDQIEDALKVFENPKLHPGHPKYIPLMGLTLSTILRSANEEDSREFRAYYAKSIESLLDKDIESRREGDDEIQNSENVRKALNFIFDEENLNSNELRTSTKVLAFHERILGNEIWREAVKSELLDFGASGNANFSGVSQWHADLGDTFNEANIFLDSNTQLF